MSPLLTIQFALTTNFFRRNQRLVSLRSSGSNLRFVQDSGSFSPAILRISWDKRMAQKLGPHMEQK